MVVEGWDFGRRLCNYLGVRWIFALVRLKYRMRLDVSLHHEVWLANAQITVVHSKRLTRKWFFRILRYSYSTFVCQPWRLFGPLVPYHQLLPLLDDFATHIDPYFVEIWQSTLKALCQNPFTGPHGSRMLIRHGIAIHNMSTNLSHKGQMKQ